MRSKQLWIIGALSIGLAARGHGASAQTASVTEADAPWPGRAKIVAMKPDWCAAFKGTRDMASGGLIDETNRMLEAGFFSDVNLNQIAAVACLQPTDPAMQAAVARWRQAYINQTGLTDREDRVAMAFRVGHLDSDDGEGWTDAKQAFCRQAAFKPSIAQQDANTEEDLATSVRESSMFEPLMAAGGCGGSALSRVGMTFDWRFAIDGRSAPRSEVARVMNVLVWLDGNWNAYKIPDVDSKAEQAAYAVFGPDARRLDRARFDAEIAKPPFDDFARLHAREAFARAKAVSDYLLAMYQIRAASDPALKALVIDAGEAGWLAWERDYAAWKPQLDAVAAYQDAFFGKSKAAKVGCSSALRKNLVGFIQAAKVSSGDDASALLRTPVGYVLAEGLLACDVSEEKWQEASHDWDLFKLRRVQRGPRAAAWWAVFDALEKIRADQSHFAITENDLGLPPQSPIAEQVKGAWNNQLSLDSDVTGQIKSVAKRDGGVLVTFKRVTYQEIDDTCETTGKVDGFNDDGSLHYHEICTITGHHTVDATPAPLLVPTDLAGGLAAGQLATFNRNHAAGAAATHGLPTEVWADKAKKRLVIWNGIPL